MIYDLVIVGGGPAGIMAAFTAKKFAPGLKVAMLERLDRVGGKLRYTAGGRANIAHIGDAHQLISLFHREQKFLYPAFNSFKAGNLLDFLEEIDVACYVNDEGRVYPKNMNGKELEELFFTRLIELEVDIFLSEIVSGIESNNGLWSLHCENSINNQSSRFEAESVIIATGCPASGRIAASKSECYFAVKGLGLDFVPLNAALAPIYSETVGNADLSGISVENVVLTLCKKKKILSEQEGAIIFTHKGLSGPAALNISRDLTPENCASMLLKIDLLPSVDSGSFDFDALSTEEERYLSAELNSKLAKRLRNYLFESSDSLHDRIKAAKNYVIDDLKAVDFDMGMQCRGGLSTGELNPRTMECKNHANLYFIGDQLNLDGPEGGYNLLMAFSTAYLAAKSVAEKTVL